MAGETETVGLNLDGSFAAQAEKDAAAAHKLVSALDKLGNAKGPPAAGGGLKLGGAGGWFTGADNASVAKLTDGSDRLTTGADKLGESSGALTQAGSGLAVSGSTLLAAGAAMAAAAAALAAAAGAVIAAGVKFGIEQTSAADIQKAIFGGIKNGAGGYELAVKLATKFGLDEADTTAKVKKLLQAKFSAKEIEVDVKIAAAIDAVEGVGKGQQYLDKLAKLKLEPKVTTKDIKSLAELGVDTKDVYAELAKSMGITVAEAEAKVKSGAVDTQKVLDAIGKSADKSFGGVADKLGASIPALLQKIKLGFAELFKGFDLKPLTGFLKNVVETLTGPVGKAMGKAFGELGSTIIKVLFGPLDGTSGKDKLAKLGEAVTAVVTKITTAVKVVGPYVKQAFEFIFDAISGKKGTAGGGVADTIKGIAKDLVSLYNSAKPLLSVLLPIVKVAALVGFTIFATGVKVAAAGLRLIIEPISRAIAALKGLYAILTGDAKGAAKAGKDIGDGIGLGMIKGIKGMIGAVVNAAAAMATSALAKIKSILGVASPAKALVFVGDSMAGGMAKGMNDNTGPQKAAAKMASGAAKAAALNSGGAGGKGGAAAGGAPSVVLNIVNHFAPGTTPGQATAVAAANAEEWRRQMRAYQRQQQEGRAA